MTAGNQISSKSNSSKLFSELSFQISFGPWNSFEIRENLMKLKTPHGLLACLPGHRLI